MFSEHGCYGLFKLLERRPSMLRGGEAGKRKLQVGSKINPSGTEEPKKKTPGF